MVVLYHERAAYYQKQRSQDSHVLVEHGDRLKRQTQESIIALVVAVGSYCWWYTMQIAVSVGGAIASWRAIHKASIAGSLARRQT